MEEEIKNTNQDDMTTIGYDEKVDIRGTMSDLFKTEEAQLSQEEAIKNYKEDNPIRKKKNASEEDESAYNEELEHLERIKKELLASLERVKKLEEKIFGETKKQKEIEKLKVSNSNSGGASKGTKKEKEYIEQYEVENEKEKGGFERTREL